MSRFERIEIDGELVAALKRREKAALAAVYRALAPAVFSLARRLLADAQQAQEATHDTFIDVIERVGTVEAPAAFVGWVRAVTVNHCLMRLRSPWRRRRVLGGVEQEQPDAASDVTRLEALSDVERALVRLPSEARFVVWMHDVEGYTHGEIAKLTGKSVSYSKSQLVRAYAKLLAWSSEARYVDRIGRTLVEGPPESPSGEGAADFAGSS